MTTAADNCASCPQVDRMFDWAVLKDAPMQESLAQQKDYVRAEFERRMQQAVLALNEQGLNVALYWSNPDPRKYVNIVPTSAITGEGVRLVGSQC